MTETKTFGPAYACTADGQTPRKMWSYMGHRKDAYDFMRSCEEQGMAAVSYPQQVGGVWSVEYVKAWGGAWKSW